MRVKFTVGGSGLIAKEKVVEKKEKQKEKKRTERPRMLQCMGLQRVLQRVRHY